MRAGRSFIWEKSSSVPLTLCSLLVVRRTLGMSSSQLIMENNLGAAGGSFQPLLHGTRVFFHHINGMEMPGVCSHIPAIPALQSIPWNSVFPHRRLIIPLTSEWPRVTVHATRKGLINPLLPRGFPEGASQDIPGRLDVIQGAN